MNISEKTIKALEQVITGDGNISPYRSGIPSSLIFLTILGAMIFMKLVFHRAGNMQETL